MYMTKRPLKHPIAVLQVSSKWLGQGVRPMRIHRRRKLPLDILAVIHHVADYFSKNLAQFYSLWTPQNNQLLFCCFLETKDVLGSVCLAIYGADLEHSDIMTVGVFYVRPDHRGTGVGTRLFGALMDEAKKHGDNVTLNGGSMFRFFWSLLLGV